MKEHVKALGEPSGGREGLVFTNILPRSKLDPAAHANAAVGHLWVALCRLTARRLTISVLQQPATRSCCLFVLYPWPSPWPGCQNLSISPSSLRFLLLPAFSQAFSSSPCFFQISRVVRAWVTFCCKCVLAYAARLPDDGLSPAEPRRISRKS